ncbi:MAG: Rrf2 family transcriptional regulator [Planctomycetota bacterium]
MKLSKTTTYAVLALECLLCQDGQAGSPMRAREVAERLGIPTDSALKVLQALARGGLLKSTLGRRGGYRANAKPDEVTLLRLIELMDGPITADVPVPANAGSTLVSALDGVCAELRDRSRAELESITLERLIELSNAEGRPALALAG